MKRLSRRFGAAAGVLAAALAAGLLVGVGTGRAATSFEVTLSPLIGTSFNEVPQVSYGGKIGYHLVVTNSGDSTTTQVQVVVKSDSATFFDATDPSCAAAKGDAKQMVCTPFGGTMKPGDTFTVDFRFTAPASGSAVNTQGFAVVAAQSVGGKVNGNSGTISWPGNTVTTSLVAGTDTTDTFLRGHESASAGGPQTFGVQLPTILFGDPFGLELGIHNETRAAPICPTCLLTDTQLTIPAASLVTNASNPFYNGTANPYTWSMSASYPPGFQLTGVFHLDDNNVGAFIPSCASLGGAPTAAAPMCWDTLIQSKNPKTVSATGQGLENGNGAFG
jgi:Domain of unknown function DUF11